MNSITKEHLKNIKKDFPYLVAVLSEGKSISYKNQITEIINTLSEEINKKIDS